MIIVFLRKLSHRSSEKAMAWGTRLNGMTQPIWSKDRGKGRSKKRI